MTSNFEIVFSSQRTECTRCGARHGIAKILQYAGIDVSNGNYFRCHACGATHTPKDDGSLRKGGRYFQGNSYRPSSNSSASQSLNNCSDIIAKSCLVSDDIFQASLRFATTNSFAQYLINLFGTSITNHLSSWRIGGDVWLGTIFHYFDADNRHINAKSVLYNTEAKRIKAGFTIDFSRYSQEPNTKEYPFVFGVRTWFNPETNCSQFTFFTRKRGYGQCLYGLWFLSQKPDALVILCESEKTAIIGSYIMPEFCWIATGGTNGLTQEKALALAHRRILVCFDSDEAGVTKTRAAAKLLDSMGIEAIGNIDGVPLALHLFETETRDGYDLADYFIEQQLLLNNAVKATTRSNDSNHATLAEGTYSEDAHFWKMCFSDADILSCYDLIFRAAYTEQSPHLTENLSAQKQTQWLNRINQAVYTGYIIEVAPHHYKLHQSLATGGQNETLP